MILKILMVRPIQDSFAARLTLVPVFRLAFVTYLTAQSMFLVKTPGLYNCRVPSSWNRESRVRERHKCVPVTALSKQWRDKLIKHCDIYEAWLIPACMIQAIPERFIHSGQCSRLVLIAGPLSCAMITHKKGRSRISIH